MANKYLIGLDGGGTKTNCVISDFDLTPLYSCQGGPSNFLMIGTQKVSETILSLILESIRHVNISPQEVESVLIGTTGAGRISDAEKLKTDFIKYSELKGYFFKSFRVDSDARVALEGAFSGRPGALLIAGTGSVIFGKDINNQIHRAGGFGRLIGDEGSGNTLGRRALNMIAREFDGRGEKTLLTIFLKRDFSITDSSQLITEVYSNNFDAASFAPCVIEAAQNGDIIAQKILDEESDELLLHVSTIFSMIGEDPLKLCLVGGTITSENYYAEMFMAKINTRLPMVKIVQAENSPEMGAVLLAKSILQS